jgi:threonine/homoserine/homoserine lactone efflux protein
MNPFIVITAATIITIIGALPFGLVNLTVLDISFHRNKIAALKVAHGAAWIEVLFGLTALIAGSLIGQFTRNHRVLQTLVLIIPALVGLAFLLKKNHSEAKTSGKESGFLKGMMLNLISIQVLLYWLFAMTYFNTRWEPEFNILFIALFALGIWIGKMGVLWVYALLSQKIFSRFGFLAKNINRVIGVVLLITVFIQFLK